MKTLARILLYVSLVVSGPRLGLCSDPVPDISANGSDLSIIIPPTDRLTVSIRLDAADSVAAPADWWILADTPAGWVFFDAVSAPFGWKPGLDLTLQAGLVTFDSIPIFDVSGLPEGVYTFYFAIDMPMNGVLDASALFFDWVQVTVASSDISTTDPDPASIMNLAPTGGPGRLLPADQVVVMFDEGLSISQANARLSQMTSELAVIGLRVVGRIPDLGIYQLEFDNPFEDPADIAFGLETVRSYLEGYTGVANVSFNELFQLYFIENDDDNSSVNGAQRCNFAVLDYYQAIPIFDQIRSSLQFSPVSVAVIDSGLWLGSGQFDDILPRLVYLEDTTAAPFDDSPYRHGTGVASLIAADNDDAFINGIASRVLGENLHLMVARATLFGDRVQMHWVLAGARRAVARGARIVNLSLGRHADGDRPSWLQRNQAQFQRLFSASPQTLFVAAAPNEGFELNYNDAIAGLPNPNLITVGGIRVAGSQRCTFDTRDPGSATGPGIDIAAPSTQVPVCCLGDDVSGPIATTQSGNSFAAPFVTSIAAIVLSVDPSMSGAQLKTFLLDENHVWPTDPEVGGKRPALIKTAANAILNRSAGSAAVDTIMDVFGQTADNIPDPSGHMANRLCGEIDFSVSGPGYSQSHSLNASNLTFSSGATNFGLIGDNMSIVNMFQGHDTVQGFTLSGFRLNQEYVIGASGGLAVSAGASGGDYVGVEGLSGSLVYTACELTTRSLPLDWFSPSNPGPDQLVFIEVAGVLNPSAVNGFIDRGDTIEEDVVYNVSGSFRTAFSLMFPDSATLDHLEQNCVGGIRHSP